MTIKRHVDIPSSPNSSSTSRSTSSIVPSSSSSSVGSPSSMSRRLNGWFAHTFSGSTTDLSLPSILSNSPSPSSKSRSVLLTAAKSGKGHLDKAVRYLLDSDSTPDKCTESIWILGVEHSGWEPPPPPSSFSASSHGHGRRSSLDFRSSTSSLDSTHHKGSKEKEKDPSANWPAEFYEDFTSRVWLTYRSHFTPIRDGRLGDLMEPCSIPDVSSVKSGRIKSGGYGSDSSSSASSPTATLKKWNWGGVVGGERGWTTDSGWGCMLRTGQSLLANALVHCHLGREWRRPPHPQRTPSYATYVQIVTWFLDAPSPEAPFSVHRMALAGKELGKDVGQWFGPSTAAGAIKTLVHAFPESGLGVALSEDGSLYESDVFAASWSGRRRQDGREWGDRPVLVLLGIRLGLDGVNPIYYDTIKLLYTFPQSVGIAGGRPSSSYYFVGSQADNLFYLDPHHARPTVPLRLPTDDNGLSSLPVDDFSDEAFSANESVGVKGKRTKKGKEKERQLSGGSTTSTGSRSSSIRSHAPSPLRLHHSTNTNTGTAELTLEDLAGSGRRPSLAKEPGDDLTPLQAHYVSAYSPAELKTFHCERIRKMPLSGLDPSMLIGFLCRNDQEWKDLRNRVGKLPRTIFSIQDERPSWGLDDDVMGMESMSDPDEEARSHLSIDEEEDDDDFELGRGDDEKLFAESRSSTSTHEGDTEEDPVDPITPGPGGRFVIPDMSKSGDSVSVVVEALDDVEDEDDDDDWATPSQSQSYAPTPMHSPTPSQSSSSQAPSSVPSSISSRSSASLPPPPPIPPQKKKKKKGNGKEQPVPVPMVKFPGGGGGGGGQDSMGDSTFAGERQRRQSIKVIKMHSQRGKDGGRTQSGGVKGVLTGD